MQFINFTQKKINVKISKRRGKVLFIAESQKMIQILCHIENSDQLNIFIITPELQHFSQVQLFIHSTDTCIKLEPVINISSKLDFS